MKIIQAYTFIVFAFFYFVINGEAQNPENLKTIVIDAGHGGKDPGALGKFTKEKDVVLSVALKFGNLIKENYPDVNVIYTRSTDVFVPLDKRAEIANKNKADLFVSIHANWVKAPHITGTETFILGLHKSQENLELAKKENSVIEFEDNTVKYKKYDPELLESPVAFGLSQRVYRDYSIEMAIKVQEQFTNEAHRHNRSVKEAGFLVLWQVTAPGILVELGFLSNAEEEKYLASSAGQNSLAKSLLTAFSNYKTMFDATKTTPEDLMAGGVATETEKPVAVQKKSEVCYKVQIASSAVKIGQGKGILSKFHDAQYYMDKGTYKYTIGESSNYDEIAKLQQKTRSIVSDCFIVAFYKGERITIAKAKELTMQGK